ncbi:MAG: Zn-ribbon domain-containing OB-fold protein [Thermodesulfobacteriota bacterium]
MRVEYNKEHPIPFPTLHPDNQGFWEGVERQELVLQRCKGCGTWSHPPRPMCPKCRSLEREWSPVSGKGTVYSWVTYREAPHPGFKVPYSVVLVELEEGVRLVSNLVDVGSEEIAIGMPVEVVFDRVNDETFLPKFRKAG